jgi:hypothetical protein
LDYTASRTINQTHFWALWIIQSGMLF